MFSQILKLRTTAGQEYFRSWVDLENRKEKLLQANDVSKWEVDFKEIQLSPEDLQRNKKVAKMLMLPSVVSSHRGHSEPQADAEGFRLP